MVKTWISYGIRWFLILLALAGNAQALGAELQFRWQADGHWQLSAHQFREVAGVEIDLRFQKVDGAQPRVVPGPVLQGALVAVNDRNPGRIRLAAVSPRPLPATGVLATLLLSPGADWRVRSFTAQISNAQGQSQPVAVRIQPAPNAPAPDAPAVNEQPPPQALPTLHQPPPSNPGPQPRRSGGGSWPPPSPLGGEGPAESENAPVHDGTEALASLEPPIQAGEPEPTRAQNNPPPAPEPRRGQQSLAPLWQLYCAGEALPDEAKLLDLLRQRNAVLSQVPPIVLSDGQREVQVVIPGTTTEPPHLGLIGAHLLELEPVAGAGWSIRLLPTAGTEEVTLLFLDQNQEWQIPLVVTPPLPVTADNGPTATLTGTAGCRQRYQLTLHKLWSKGI